MHEPTTDKHVQR